MVSQIKLPVLGPILFWTNACVYGIFIFRLESVYDNVSDVTFLAEIFMFALFLPFSRFLLPYWTNRGSFGGKDSRVGVPPYSKNNSRHAGLSVRMQDSQAGQHGPNFPFRYPLTVGVHDTRWTAAIAVNRGGVFITYCMQRILGRQGMWSTLQTVCANFMQMRMSRTLSNQSRHDSLLYIPWKLSPYVCCTIRVEYMKTLCLY